MTRLGHWLFGTVLLIVHEILWYTSRDRADRMYGWVVRRGNEEKMRKFKAEVQNGNRE